MGKERKERSGSRRHREPDDSRKKTHRGHSDGSSASEMERRRKRKKKKEQSDDEARSEDDRRRERRRDRRSKKSSKHKRSKKRRKRSYSSSSSSSSDSSSDDSSSDEGHRSSKKKVVNERLLAKLEARGETLEERKARRAQKRAALITTKFGYTAEENPFNDPNLHEKFTWKKREEKQEVTSESQKKTESTFNEIEKVRQRRKDRELQWEEMERIRAEESRMKELENYDDWARKEEEFHLQQQRQRSAIRLVEGREKPIDVLAKNMLLFGLSEEDKKSRASVKYQEKYNAMEALESLEAELEEPHKIIKMLKLEELEELRVDIDAFRMLEREAAALASGGYHSSAENPVLEYWDKLATVVDDELKFLKSGGSEGAHAKMVEDVQKIFEGQSTADLNKMKIEVNEKIRANASDMDFDRKYWMSVAEQLDVFLAKATLSEQHSKMLVRQLEKLEKRREELAKNPEPAEEDAKPSEADEKTQGERGQAVALESGDLEEELGLSNEIDLNAEAYSWQDKYRPRKPRYFNRVKTGYDWNKYNQTHYDKDNPPPKIVQGYKFNIFYTDLIDPTKTPQFKLEPADSDEFCILRFHAGAPYEDIAFKIINREWNRSRKRGYKCTFERGVLSLYFNFTTHWYRR